MHVVATQSVQNFGSRSVLKTKNVTTALHGGLLRWYYMSTLEASDTLIYALLLVGANEEDQCLPLTVVSETGNKYLLHSLGYFDVAQSVESPH